jgi:xylulose-5-phosphate/fructose-6-phosphate phosphoketolase
MTVRNEMDRFHLVIDVIKHLKLDSDAAVALKVLMEQKLVAHSSYINIHGIDMPEIRNWKWDIEDETAL